MAEPANNDKPETQQENDIAKKPPVYIEAEFKVHIGDNHFECELDVLRSHTTFFDAYESGQEVTLPANRVTAEAFGTIYDWAVGKRPPMPREQFRDLLTAAEYLKMDQLFAYIKKLAGEGKGDYADESDDDDDKEQGGGHGDEQGGGSEVNLVN